MVVVSSKEIERVFENEKVILLLMRVETIIISFERCRFCDFYDT
jgi:hypothetical protein